MGGLGVYLCSVGELCGSELSLVECNWLVVLFGGVCLDVEWFGVVDGFCYWLMLYCVGGVVLVVVELFEVVMFECVCVCVCDELV